MGWLAASWAGGAARRAGALGGGAGAGQARDEQHGQNDDEPEDQLAHFNLDAE
nr:hypothetical protein [Bordetella parapertussis]